MNIYIILMLITTVWMGAIGFVDDYIKVFKKDKEGLAGRFKIMGQVGLALIIGWTMYFHPDIVVREQVALPAKVRASLDVHKRGDQFYYTQDIKSTITNVPFYKELGNAGLKAKDVPVVAFSVGEEELRGVDTKPLVGHLAAWNYFQSIKNPANDEFIKKWGADAKAKNIAGHKDKPLTNDPMEATYIGINMWKQAVEKAKSTEVDKVIAAMAGQTFKAPSGIVSKMDEKNHHLHKSVFIGEVKADGQFNVVWKTPGPVKAKPWSPYIEGNDKKPDEPAKK
jgi:hypothetical protein